MCHPMTINNYLHLLFLLGEAQAILTKANAKAKAISTVATALAAKVFLLIYPLLLFTVESELYNEVSQRIFEKFETVNRLRG